MKSELFSELDEKYPNQDNNDGIYISLGGPLQTILTSLIGLSILLYRRKNDYGLTAANNHLLKTICVLQYFLDWSPYLRPEYHTMGKSSEHGFDSKDTNFLLVPLYINIYI